MRNSTKNQPRCLTVHEVQLEESEYLAIILTIWPMVQFKWNSFLYSAVVNILEFKDGLWDYEMYYYKLKQKM